MFYPFTKIGCYLAQVMLLFVEMIDFSPIFDISEIKLLCPTTSQICDDSFAFS